LTVAGRPKRVTTTLSEQAGARRPRLLVVRWAPAFVALVAFAVASALVLPRMSVDGSAREVVYAFGAGQPVPGLRLGRAVERGPANLLVPPLTTAKASFALPAPQVAGDDRTLLFVDTGTVPQASTRVALVDRNGVHHALGAPTAARPLTVEVTRLIEARGTRIEFAANNPTGSDQGIANQVRVTTYPPSAVPRAGRWEVAAWVAIAVLLVLALLGRVRRDAPLVFVCGLGALLAWPSVKAGALNPQFPEIWNAAVHGGWLRLDDGMLSGTFGRLPALTIQLFHALIPLSGSGAAAAGTAGMLVGIGALAAIYALGRRLAGLPGALTATACALLADPFRDSLSTGGALGTLVLAATLFAIAVHRTLVRPDRAALILLGGAGGLAILAEPIWWPGVVGAAALLAVRETPRGEGWRALALVLAALVVISLPSRVSVADQHHGDLSGDLSDRATAARNAEFTDLQSESRVGVVDYLFDMHAPSAVASGVVTGGRESTTATTRRPVTRAVGLVAFLVEAIGVLYLLLVPRLRLLVLVPAMLAVVPWFFAAEGGLDPLLAGAAFWPALLAGAATIAYLVTERVRRR
jgi:hypothetical protein